MLQNDEKQQKVSSYWIAFWGHLKAKAEAFSCAEATNLLPMHLHGVVLN